MQKLSKFIFFKLMGWRIVGDFPALKKMIIIVVPHTSWHDFYIGVFVRAIAKIQINFIGKRELFKWPFGAYFRWMGGTPIDRTPGQDKVKAIANIFLKKDEFRLALAPEGTRKKVEQWKTGFYFIAKEAKVPIVMVAFDYGTKTVKIAEPFYPTDDQEADFIFMRSFYKGVVGKVPEYS
ncbi:1-acyl-sn-glycerol-3-phosphate acyltransferase [Flavobacteriaceae bacterium M23B6Z8]